MKLESLSVVLSKLLNAKETSVEQLAASSAIHIGATWEIPAIDLGDWRKDGESFVDYFNSLIKPLGDLIGLTQDGEIKRLEELISDLRQDIARQNELLLKTNESWKGILEKRIAEFEIYKTAIRDSK